MLVRQLLSEDIHTRIDRRSYRRHGGHAPNGTAHGVVSWFSRGARENGHELGSRRRVFYAVLVVKFVLRQRSKLAHGEVSREIMQEFLSEQGRRKWSGRKAMFINKSQTDAGNKDCLIDDVMESTKRSAVRRAISHA